MLEVAADAQCQGTGKLVCLEGSDVEHEGEDAVSEQGENDRRGEATLSGELAETGDFSGAVCVDERLYGGERGHAQKEFEGRKLEAAGQQTVGCDGLVRLSVKIQRRSVCNKNCTLMAARKTPRKVRDAPIREK